VTLTSKNGTITLRGADISIAADASIAAGTGVLNFFPSRPTSTIGLGGGAGDFNLDDTEIGRITSAGWITFGEPGVHTGLITVQTLASPAAVSSATLEFNSLTGGLVIDDAGTAAGIATGGTGIINISLGPSDLVVTQASNAFPEIQTDGTIYISISGLNIGTLTNPVQFAGGQDDVRITGLDTDVYLDGLGSLTLGTISAQDAIDLNVTAANGVSIAANITTLGGSVSVDADSDNNAIGDFAIADGATLATSNGVVSVTADDISFAGTGAVDAGTGNVTYEPSTGITVGVGTGTGDFTVSNTEINQTTSTGIITIGNASASNMLVVDATAGAKNITLVTGGTLNDDGVSNGIRTTGKLTLDATGAIGSGANTFDINDVSDLAIQTEADFDITSVLSLTALSIITDGTVASQTLEDGNLSSSLGTYNVSEAGNNTTITRVDTGAGDLTFSYQNTAGNIIIEDDGGVAGNGGIRSGSGDVTLSAYFPVTHLTGTITETTAATANTNIASSGKVSLIAGSDAGTVIGGAAANEEIIVSGASAYDLRAGDDIHVQSAGDVEIRDLSLTTLATGTGTIDLNLASNVTSPPTVSVTKAGGSATVQATKATGDKMDFAFTATEGNIIVADVAGGGIVTTAAGTGQADDGDVTLTTSADTGTITEEADTNDVLEIIAPTGRQITLIAGSAAGGSIGSGAPLDIEFRDNTAGAATTGALEVDTGGAIEVNLPAARLTALTMTARTAANVTRDITGAPFTLTTDFNITSTDGANFTINRVNSNANDLNFKFTGTGADPNGNITIADTDDAIITGSGNIELISSVGSILEAGNAFPVKINSNGIVSLTAADGIGSPGTGALGTSAGGLAASVTGTGNIFLDEENAVTLAGIVAADGDITITAGNTITLGGQVFAKGSAVSLNAATGNIDIDADITSFGTITLTADTNITLSDADVGAPGTVTLTATNGAITEDGADENDFISTEGLWS